MQDTIVSRTNIHHQTLSICGEDMGGGPYVLDLNGAHEPVRVRTIPVWARGWHDVYRVLRAVLTAWDLAPTVRQPVTPGEAYDYARALWAVASGQARRGREVTCWSILGELHPLPTAVHGRQIGMGA